MKHFLFILFSIACFQKGIAQHELGILSGSIASEESNFVVVLKKATDSTIIKSELTDPNNQFIFQNIAYGHYFIEIYFLNKIQKKVHDIHINSATQSIPAINVEIKSHELNTVKISDQKPLVERKNDKLIYNVENSLEAPSNDALTVLQKAPGIIVNQVGSLSMRGKQRVNVLINGRMTYVSGEQLSNILKTTTASQIAKIEIISNPSSKYDAEGSAGIVNIILKKDQRVGTNGLIIMSGGYGKYYKSTNGININSRGKKLNVFASYNMANNLGFNDLKLHRKFYQNNLLQGAYRQSNYLLFPSSTHILKAGFDYQLNTTSELGFVASATSTAFKPKGDNLSYVENNLGIDTSYYTSSNRSDERWNNISLNGHYVKRYKQGAELSSDVDVVKYLNTSDQDFTTHYYNLQHQMTNNPYFLKGDFNGRLSIYSAKIDWTMPLTKNSKLESGLKSSLVSADNNLSYLNLLNGNYFFDSSQSNHFLYEENINAIYSSISTEYHKHAIQIGMRAEQTRAKGLQKINGNEFDRNYWQLFPTVFYTYQHSNTHQFGFSASRRIQRPSYESMNPIKLFIDANTYKTGNPYLVPQNSYIIELNHTYKQKLITTLAANITNKSITEVLIPDETQNNITIQINKNINKQYNYSLSFSLPTTVAKWWSMSNETSLYYTLFDGFLANMAIHSGNTSFNAKSIHQFTLAKHYKLQLDAFVQYKQTFTFSKLNTFGGVNLAIQRNVYKNRLQCKVSANDIFYTMRFRGSSSYTNYYESFNVQRDSRTIILTLSYRYGKNTVPGANRRNTSAEDEKQRAGKNV
ncbi:MAG: outer membrane beta-barrel protein [Chitinophagaceae bacterium]